MNPKLSYVSKYYKPTTLVIAGGGVKCISLCGVMEYLEKSGVRKSINKIYAVSSGALFAILFSLGYNTCDMHKEIYKMSNSTIFGVNNPLSTNIISLATSALDLYRNCAINNMETLTNYVINLFEKKGVYAGISFENFKKIIGISLNIFATNVDKYKIKCFCPEKTPNVSVITALLGSMSIPFLFKCIKIGKMHYSDGGLMCNFPFEYAEENKTKNEEILGLYFSIIPKKISDEYDYIEKSLKMMNFISNIINIVFRVNQPSGTVEEQTKRGICEIKIPEGNFIDFNLTREQKKMFIDCGYSSIKKFIINKILIRK
jgi:predicted acylesterase/phospholipase RssA